MKAYVFLIMIFLLVVGCDGGKIIYYQTQWNEFEDNVGSFHTIKIDGTDDKVIIEDLKIPKDAHVGPICPSPNGQQIVFATYRHWGPDPETVIHVIDMDGTNQSELLRAERLSISIKCWSSEYNKILFTEYVGKDSAEIFIMDADGSNQEKILAGNVGEAAWSTTGDKIIFHKRTTNFSNGNDKTGFYSVDRNGLNIRFIVEYWPSSGDDTCYPENFSKKGNRLLCSTRDWEGENALYFIDFPGPRNDTDLNEGGALEISGSNGKPIGGTVFPKENTTGIWNKTLIAAFGDDWHACELWLENEEKILGTYWDEDNNDNMYVINSDGTGKVGIKKGPHLSFACNSAWVK